MGQDQQRDGGAFWWANDRETGAEKRTRNGDRYMTGNVTINGVKHNASLFFTPAARKKNPKQPDIAIVFSTPQGGAEMNGVRDRMKNVPTPQSHEEPGVAVADIPF